MSRLLLYIDPSTGSMFFALILGLVSAAFFGFRLFMMKVGSGFGVNADEIQNKKRLDYVIFSDNKRYFNVFEPICDEFEKRGIEVSYFTMSEDDPALNKKYNYVKCEYIGSGNIGFAKLNFLNAKICLSTTPGLDVYQWKRSKNCPYYVHIAHSAGLNRGAYRMFGTDYYDAILAASEHSFDYVRELETKRNLPHKEIVTVGSTYLDTMMERYNNTQKSTNKAKTVLIAPTWGINNMFENYGTRVLDEVLKAGYKVIVRPHPQTLIQDGQFINKLQEKYGNKVEWSLEDDNFDVLNRSDIMISDFSGVIFDYTLIFDKPVIYTKIDMDWSQFDGASLDDNSWTDKILEKFAVELNSNNLDNLKNIIDDMLNNDKYAEGRKYVKNETWQNIGKAKESVVDYLTNKIKSIN